MAGISKTCLAKLATHVQQGMRPLPVNRWNRISFVGIHVTKHCSREIQQLTHVCAYSSYICAYVFSGLMMLTCGMVTTGISLMWTAGVTGALPGGSNHYQGDNSAGSAHIASGHVLQFRSSAAAPDPGTYKTDGDS